MLSPHIYAHLAEIAAFRPFIDICTDKFGSNSLCKEFYTVDDDSLSKDLAGMKVACNPPYLISKLFIEKLQDAKKANAETKALLIVPEHTRFIWFKDMIKSNKWRIIWRFPKNSQVFSRPDEQDVYNVSKRDHKYWTRWPVLVLVFNDAESAKDDKEPYNCAAHWKQSLNDEKEYVPGYAPRIKVKTPVEPSSSDGTHLCEVCRKRWP